MQQHDEFLDRSITALDWPAVVAALHERASTAVGRELCADPPLADDLAPIQLLLAQVTQARALMAEERFPFGGILDVRTHVTRCSKGELLDGPPLIEVADTLAGLAALKRFLAHRADQSPDLQDLADRIIALHELQSRLAASFDRHGELSMVTYPHLAEMRGRKARLHETIRGQLEDMTGTAEWQGALQDDYLTVRNDRYVVPIKVQAKSMDLGIVHDTSGSGQTIFVEPREVVGLNNRLKMADAELRREEQAILASLCEVVAVHGHDIREGLDAAAELDAIAARARLADDLHATQPTLTDGLEVRLCAARHPLLALRGLDVVANDLRLDPDRCALILSGPNAGGKTITLKTLGLLCLMVRAGMHLPAEDGSRIGLFPLVLADIGDQQSVDQDLSTFSAHLLALRTILELLQADRGPALVLLDEIAVGTDPQQGAALAASVLRVMLERGALVAATTHFAPLKALAEVDDRVVNGRLEFDPDVLRPTYRLSTGNPGRSYAFDIARQLGLPDELLAAAEARLEPTHREVEALLASLEQERAEVRAQRIEARQQAERNEAALADLERRIEAVQLREKQLREEVLASFDDEVEGYREVVRGVIRELQKKPSLHAADRARRRIASGGQRVRDQVAARTGIGPRDDAERVDWTTAQVGDRVVLLAGAKEATIVSLPDHHGRLEVQVGPARVRCKQRDVGPATQARPRSQQPRHDVPVVPFVGELSDELDTDLDSAVRTPDRTLDLRGKRVDAALDRVDRFLDDASMRGWPAVFILHGHGTGAMRKAVRQHLADSLYVREFRSATRSQGGDGVTAVRL